jgi:hypothetical protein
MTDSTERTTMRSRWTSLTRLEKVAIIVSAPVAVPVLALAGSVLGLGYCFYLVMVGIGAAWRVLGGKT